MQSVTLQRVSNIKHNESQYQSSEKSTIFSETLETVLKAAGTACLDVLCLSSVSASYAPHQCWPGLSQGGAPAVVFTCSVLLALSVSSVPDFRNHRVLQVLPVRSVSVLEVSGSASGLLKRCLGQSVFVLRPLVIVLQVSHAVEPL